MKKNLADVWNFVAWFPSLPFNGASAQEYATIRADLAAKGTPIGPNDLMIAAIVIVEFCKQFPAADVTAIIENEEGVMLGMMDASGDQRIERCLFLKGLNTPVSYPNHKNLLPLKGIDPLVLSEVLADLTKLGEKGK